MTAIVIAVAALAGGLWRRWFGGVTGAWWARVTGGLTSGKTVSRFAVLVFTLPAWLSWPWLGAAVLSASTVVYFSLGQDFDKPLKVLWRYSLPLIALCAGADFWWGLPVAFVPTIACIELRDRPGLAWWIFDGWEAWWEACLGASAIGLLVSIPILA